MSTALDMSLEDIIKANKKSKTSAPSSSSRGKPPRSSGPGPSRRGPPNRAADRSAPYSKPARAPEAAWQHDMFTEASGPVASGRGSRAGSLETGTKILISNLDYGVSEDDIKELFSEVGDMKRYTVHYDRSGRSEGTAEIVFARRDDAVAAVKRYNNVQLDGKPMKIEIVAKNVPATPSPSADGFNRNQNGAGRRQGRGRSTGGPRGGNGGGGGSGSGRGARAGKGRGKGRAEKEKVSAEDLDADLEKYHSGAMQED